MIFNERLRLLREERQLTQEKVARGMDMPVRSYQRLELNGKTHYDTLIKIADFYDVSVLHNRQLYGVATTGFS